MLDKGKAPMEEDDGGNGVSHGVGEGPNSIIGDGSIRFCGEDQQNSIRSFVFESPNGSRYWTPKVTADYKPVVGVIFENEGAAFDFYKVYAEKSGFSVRWGSYKKWNQIITHRHFICRKFGKPKCSNSEPNNVVKLQRPRLRTYKTCDCKASLKIRIGKDYKGFQVYKFVEAHNHDLCSDHNADLTKTRRQLSFFYQHFIHRMSLNKVGPRVAHRLQCGLRGGAHNIRGTETDYVNFSRKIRKYIGCRDAKMFVAVMEERAANLPNFSFECTLVLGELKAAFWADDVSKINFQQFGDVIAFDATYHTNKYDMIFVPFTGVDHHQKGITFGAGVLSSESVESYKWLLQRFVNAHPQPPKLILTDQDPALSQAVESVFPESKHRLCMWHIMKKLPAKFSSDFLQNSTFRASIHKLVWNVFLPPSTFERRWNRLITEFKLTSHVWLQDMFAIRDHWVPAYFRDIPMCCLLKTTSRCESSNAAFKVNSGSGNTLLQFLFCFDTVLDRQRYKQRLLEHKSNTTTVAFRTPLDIEKHAFELYTQEIFLQVQKEIFKGMMLCFITNYQFKDVVEVYVVHHADKRTVMTNCFEVRFNPSDLVVSCTCMGFTRIWYLCRHVFCVFRLLAVDNSEFGLKRNELLDLVSECMDRLRGNTEGFNVFIDQIRKIKNEIFKNNSVVSACDSTSVAIRDLVGTVDDSEVLFTAPQGIKNKGSGTRKRRPIGPVEIASNKKKKNIRKCGRCGEVVDHDARNCPLNHKEPSSSEV